MTIFINNFCYDLHEHLVYTRAVPNRGLYYLAEYENHYSAEYE